MSLFNAKSLRGKPIQNIKKIDLKQYFSGYAIIYIKYAINPGVLEKV
jgi:hypothetical protein